MSRDQQERKEEPPGRTSRREWLTVSTGIKIRERTPTELNNMEASDNLDKKSAS